MKNRITYFLIWFCILSYAQELEFVNTGDMIVSKEAVLSTRGSFFNQSGKFINNGLLRFHADFINDADFKFEEESQAVLWAYSENNLTSFITGNTSLKTKEFIQDVASDLNLLNDLYIQTHLELLAGKIVNRDSGNILFLDRYADYYQFDNLTYVDGFLTKRIHRDFDYPIGSLNYNPLKLKDIVSPLRDISSVHFKESANLIYSFENKDSKLDYVDDTSYWRIKSNQQNKAKLEARLFPEHLSERLRDNIELLSFVTWNFKSQKWELIPSKLSNDGRYLESLRVVDLPRIVCLGLRKPKDAIFIYNAVNPNDIGGNNYLRAEGVGLYPENQLKVYNTSGEKVFESKSTKDDVEYFVGISNQKGIKPKELPEGVYYYEWLFYGNTDLKPTKKIGYLYLVR